MLALRELRSWQDSFEVLENAVTLAGRDHTFPSLRLFLSLELALRGDTEKALAHFRELPANGWSKFMSVQLQFVKGLLAVLQASPDDRKKVFKAERAAIKQMMSKNRMSLFRADYRRCMLKMAKESRQTWFVFLTWIGV